MPANGQVVRVKKSGGDVTIEFVVGHAQWGRFRAFLWDKDGKNSIKIGEGINTDQIPDIWKIPGKPVDLNESMVSWEVAIGPLGNGPGQLYSLSVRFAQDGTAIPGGAFLDSGALGDAKFINDFVTLEAV